MYSNLQCKREGYVQRLKDEQGEGCTIHGFVNVNKVAGNFHFAPGKSLDQSFNFLQDLLNLQPETYNASRAKLNSLYPYRSTYSIVQNRKLIIVYSPLHWKQISHKINKLSFGEEFPGVVNPLDGYSLELELNFQIIICIALCSTTFPWPNFSKHIPELSGYRITPMD